MSNDVRTSSTVDRIDLDARFAAAHEIADQAAQLAHRHFERRLELTVTLKGPQDHVSAADLEVESLIRKQVSARFPTDAVLGEEHGGAVSDEVWVVDPIDGTTNFVHGLPHFAVSIAFVHRGQVELGVVLAPVLKELFSARRGGGATLNGAPIRVSDCRGIDQALIGLGSSRRRPTDLYLAVLGRLLAQGVEYRRLGSAALNLCQVAAGRLDGYYEAHLSSWDAAAGLLIVHEAGGRTNDFLSGDGLSVGNAMLASNPALFDGLSLATGVR